MPDFFSSLQSETGLAPEAVESGVGALLSFIKERLPAEVYAGIESALPHAQQAISTFLAGESKSGMLGQVGSLIGNLFGEKVGDLPKLLEMLAKSGLSIDQAKAFLPAAIAMLKDHLPEELVEQIFSRIPGLGEARV
ncbi:DUF2780 domain-containing protein [Tautonia sp. JC769]|uniref:DUF2780 domain-containing protein n=1 Tax=Tautonia sp. JC769 TaxID=3232135 RepID=UPI0034580747